MRRPRAMEISTFTIIKGSLIPETYAAFRAWDFDGTNDENFERLEQANVIGAKSTNWLRDVIKVLHRRFAPSSYDRALVLLAQAQCPMDVWRPILLWHLTRDEFLVRDFVVRWLASEFESGRYAIRTEDVLDYFSTLESGPARQVAEWSETTRQRVAAGLLRIAADFGLLRGSTVKHFASYQLPDESFLYVLHAIAESEPNARKIIESPEWRLYLLGPTEVEQALFRLHQFRRVHYEVAGSLAQLQLPCGSSMDFARRLCA
jgi:bacteriophage exclusion system BrxA-like protein